MRRADVERLVDTLEYERAKYRLTRVSDIGLRKRYTEIVRNYEVKYSITTTNILKRTTER